MAIKPSYLEDIKISDYDYSLPDERIAKYPLPERDKSKLLVYKNRTISQFSFSDIIDILLPTDVLVFNNTRVIPARLLFKKNTGANIEIFCLEPIDPPEYTSVFQSHRCTWKCIVGNLKKWKSGNLQKELIIDGKKVTVIAEKIADYQTNQHIRFSWSNKDIAFEKIIENMGKTPIPPYLNRESDESDKERYQTVYSHVKGSVAAPTAGLHFTETLINKIRAKGIKTEELTLHVGAGTFKPVQSEVITDHEMHTEYFSVSQETVKKLIENAENLVSVGTTTLRTLESLYWLGIKLKEDMHNSPKLYISQWDAYKNENKLSYSEALQNVFNYMCSKNLKEMIAGTQIMMVPGYKPRSINALITNFHQPKSTLLLLVASIIGNDWRKIYNYALEEDFRFLSYGDGSILFI